MKLFKVILPCITLLGISCPAYGQITSAPNSGTMVTRQGKRINIKGGRRSRNGRNQFHSFDKFGLRKSQTANFITNRATRNILGRVVGGSPSVINGLIKVQGGKANLFLMNPAGMLFGKNARLDVPAAFTATTANGIGFSKGWFSGSGDNNYADLIGNPTSFAFTTSNSGAIINSGDLQVNPGERLTLLGSVVVNTGQVKADGGQVTLAAVPGSQLVQLTQEGHLLNLVFEPLSKTETLPNDWTLPIVSLPSLLTGVEMQHASDLSVNEQGQVVLTGAGVTFDGKSGTAIASGRLDVANAAGKGGIVHVLGEKVGVVDANVTASGARGGGEVSIGGSFQGKGPLPNAQVTYVNDHSTIIADALDHGDGGNVIAWANETTEFKGRISANGGKHSGNGGFAEVSGKENLIFRGEVNLSSIHGDFGNLILDPQKIEIVESNGGANDNEVVDSEILGNDGDIDQTFTISENAVEALAGNTNIIFQAIDAIEIISLSDNELTFSGSGQIFFDAGGSFVMKATDTISTQDRNIKISASDITAGEINTFGKKISLSAKLGNLFAENLDSGGENGGDIELNAPNGNITTKEITAEGSVSINGMSVDILENIKTSGHEIHLLATKGDIKAKTIESAGEKITLDAKAQNIIDAGNINAEKIDSGGNQITLTAEGNIKISNDVDSDGGQIELSAEKHIETSNIESDNGQITLLAGGNIKTSDIISNLGPISVASNGNVDITGLTESSSREISISAGSNLTANNINSNGSSIFLIAGKDINLDGDIISAITSNVGGRIFIKANEQVIMFDEQKIDSGGGAITFKAGDAVELELENISSSFNGKNGFVIFESDRDITLKSTNNLNLNNVQFKSGGGTRLVGNQVSLGSESFNPFIIKAKGDISIEGDGGISIDSPTNSPQKWIQSGKNINLSSSDSITSNAFFATDGTFTASDVNPLSINTISLDATNSIIRSEGDVSFSGDYSGPSLKIETQGSINGNDIIITEPAILNGVDINNIDPDKIYVAFDSDIAYLASSPSLILRAGEDTIIPNLISDSQINRGGTTIDTSSSLSAQKKLQVKDIKTSTQNINGPVILSADGKIMTENITTGNGLQETSSTISFSEKGGFVSLTSTGSGISVRGDIFTSGVGEGGDIQLSSVDDIQVDGGINSSSFLSRGTNDNLFTEVTFSEELRSHGVQGGDITLMSEESNIFVAYINSSGLNSDIFGQGGGQAGDITIESPKGLFRATEFIPASIVLDAAIDPGEDTVSILAAGSTPPEKAFRGGTIMITTGGQFATGITFENSIGPSDTNNLEITANDSFQFSDGQSGTAGAIVSRNSNGVDRAAHIDTLLEPGTATSGQSIGNKNNNKIQITTNNLPGDTDPGDTDPGDTDPGNTDPGDTDPGDTDPGDTDPGDTDPGDTDPGDTDPGNTDPGDTDPGNTDPGDTDPGDTDPGDTDPGDTDSGDTDSGDSDSGDTDSGDSDSGDSDSGDTDSGDPDSGDSNSGDTDSGNSDSEDDACEPEGGESDSCKSAPDSGDSENMKKNSHTHNGGI